MNSEPIFRIAFWVLLGALLVIRIVSMLRVRRAGERFMPDWQAIEREGKATFAARIVGFLFLIPLLTLYTLNPPWMEVLSIPLPVYVRWMGFTLGLVSLAFWAWAQAALGKEWSPQLQLRQEHRLVTTGPYSRVRHPIYTAMFGLGASFALETANWVFMLLLIAVTVGLPRRVPKEEQMMIEEFGQEYQEYMRKTGRFFPKI
jgi:protein-S-isoprenylcysteine O-methyltransferase Ste14